MNSKESTERKRSPDVRNMLDCSIYRNLRAYEAKAILSGLVLGQVIAEYLCNQ